MKIVTFILLPFIVQGRIAGRNLADDSEPYVLDTCGLKTSDIVDLEEGGTITMEKWLYCKSGIIIDTKGVTIDCGNKGFYSSVADNNGIGIEVKAKKVTIKDCNAIKFKYGITAKDGVGDDKDTIHNLNIFNSYVAKNIEEGIWVENIRGLKIHESAILGNGGTGFWGAYVKDLSITESGFNGNTDYGI